MIARGRRYNRAVVKIDPLKPWSAGAGRAAGARKATAAGVKPGGRGKGRPLDLAQLVAEIDESGDELKRDPTGRGLERYKSAVQRFLDSAIADSMSISSEASLGLANKVFSTVTKVNIALADLTDAVIGRQPDTLRAASLIDQMKGLLVDLYR
ncbi:MAG: hypothetical protein C0409_14480 [Novosphingobium sp.]|nr:hypothetical protein [Novosphingobium sp.]